MNNRTIRIEQLQNQAARFGIYLNRLKKISLRFSTLRLIIFLTGMISFLILFFFFSDLYAYISAGTFITAFGIFVMQHNKIDFEIKKVLIVIKIKEQNIARIKIDWKNIPFNNILMPDDAHPFEADLSITGKYSLHHLINISSTKEGALLLRDWLTVINPDYDSIQSRQNIIKELTPLVRFREKLQLNSAISSKHQTNGEKLFASLKTKSDLKILKKILTSLYTIIAINIILFILFLLVDIPAYFSIGLLVQLAVYWFNSKHINSLFDNAIDIKDELGKLSRVMEFLELYPYAKNSELRNFCEPFLKKNLRPSDKFKKVNGAISAISFQKNPFTELLFNLVFPWDYYHAYRLEKVKQEISEHLPVWLNTWYNLEALNSLANLAFINPDYSFPVISKQTNSPVFSIENARHPLIPFEQNIPNDFTFTNIGESIIITGSNMSGKSTFLKTIGLNLALCYAGGPVFASDLQTSLFRMFTCIKINDSVIDGISYFYAEVKRLKSLLLELKKDNELPLIYLIDEIFRGTNNLERLIGSRSYIKELAGSNSIGLISTHDLELVRLEDEIKNISNYHFREELLENKMIFDYKIRKGPCPTTNALKIMELEGLPIER